MGGQFEAGVDPLDTTTPASSERRREAVSLNAALYRVRSERDQDDEFKSKDEEGGNISDNSYKVLVNPVAECRHYSRSAWLHFPHIELMFLFFAFEGAIVSQLSVLRDGDCPAVFFTAAIALVSHDIVLFKVGPVILYVFNVGCFA